jgi:hypothetical protein
MIEEMTGFNRNTVRKILVEDSKKEKSPLSRFVHVLTPD